MHHSAGYALTRQRLCIEFLALKHACPQGIYIAPVPHEPLLWAGVIFVRKGPYANAILRFQVTFPDDYPSRPPILAFLTDVFHPLVAPLTTYTHTTRERGVDAAKAEEKLPPGGLSLRHGFPEWYHDSPAMQDDNTPKISVNDETVSSTEGQDLDRPHIVEVLQYLRIILDTELVIDSIPLEGAANSGAWHAWRSHRARFLAKQSAQSTNGDSSINRDRSMSPTKQPGGARRPGEWNWTGVWEDRVRKVVQASIAESTLYGGEGTEVIDFVKIDDEDMAKLEPIAQARQEPAS